MEVTDLVCVAVTVPRHLLLTSNGPRGGHWGAEAKKRAELRSLGYRAWWRSVQRRTHGPALDRALLEIEVVPDVRARRDVMNLATTWKPLIDGMVTGPTGWPQGRPFPGVLPDDSSAFLRGPLPWENLEELAPRGQFRFVFHFKEWA